MKFITTFLAIFICSSLSAQAAWVDTKIQNMQINSTSTYVYITITDPIVHMNTSCNFIGGQTGFILKQANNGFEELYARILIAQQNDDVIGIQDTATFGNCISGNRWLSDPYIRFE